MATQDSTRVLQETQNRKPPLSPGGRVGILLLTAISFLGYFKATVFLSWVPFEPTLPLVGLLLIAIARSMRDPAVRERVAESLGAVLGLWLLFVPGAVYALGSGYGIYKVSYLFTITLLTAAAPCFLLGTEHEQRYWLKASFACSAAMAIGLLLTPDSSYLDTFGRFTVEGSSSIGAARVIGSGAVMAIILALVGRGRLRLVGFFAAVALLLALVLIGSKGPFLGAVLAIAFTVAAAPRFHGRRLIAVLVLTASSLLAMYTLATSNSEGGLRILAFLSGERQDTNREALFRVSASSISARPLGVGWDGFAWLIGEADTQKVVYTHNMLLEVFSEGGWVAGFGLICFAFIALKRLRRNAVDGTGTLLLGSAVYWFLVAQTSSDVNGNRLTFLSLALGFVLANKRASRAPGECES